MRWDYGVGQMASEFKLCHQPAAGKLLPCPPTAGGSTAEIALRLIFRLAPRYCCEPRQNVWHHGFCRKRWPPTLWAPRTRHCPIRHKSTCAPISAERLSMVVNPLPPVIIMICAPTNGTHCRNNALQERKPQKNHQEQQGNLLFMRQCVSVNTYVLSILRACSLTEVLLLNQLVMGAFLVILRGPRIATHCRNNKFIGQCVSPKLSAKSGSLLVALRGAMTFA